MFRILHRDLIHVTAARKAKPDQVTQWSRVDMSSKRRSSVSTVEGDAAHEAVPLYPFQPRRQFESTRRYGS